MNNYKDPVVRRMELLQKLNDQEFLSRDSNSWKERQKLKKGDNR